MGRQDMLDAGNEGRRAMRVHSWSEFAWGAAGFSVGIALLLRGNGVDGLFGVGWIAIGAVHLWRAFNKAWCARTKEQEEKQRRAARQAAGKRASRAMFGRWAPLMEWLGIILIWSALPLVYLRPGAWKLGMVLLFGGLGYQLWLNVTLKRRMEEQETQ